MAQRGAPDGWDSLPDPPSVLRVTVEPGPGGRAGGPRRWPLRALAAVSLIVASAVVGAALLTGGNGAARHSFTQTPGVYITSARDPVMRGVDELVTESETYRFPLGCMGSTMTAQELAVALRARTGPCWRYGVFVTAILRRVDGVWGLALEATSRSCPRVPLPATVRAQLAECRR